MKDLVSIIVPVYNAQNTIETTVNSLQNQDYANIEIVLINDGSTDNSVKLCENMRKYDNRISLYSIKNSGPSVARQYGLDRAKGRYVAFCDADDTMESTMISTLYHLIQMHQCQLSISSFKNNSRSNELADDSVEIWNQEEAIEHCLVDIQVGGFLWNKLFDLSIIRAHNIRFDESVYYCEDMEFVVEYLLYSEKIAYTKQALYNYIYQEGSLSSGDMSWKKLTNILAREKVLNMLQRTKMQKVISLAVQELVLQSVYGGRSIEKANDNEVKKMTKEQFENITSTIKKNCHMYGWNVVFHERASLKDKVNIIRFGFWKKWKRK